ncbi:MAG: hemerythrin family protein [Deltaproteobacteria bacterium]|nr:hemerythrin family protein [Deltaproteobacteria bacterium]
MKIEWTETLSVGVTAIDSEHRELFNKIGTLVDAMQAGKGAEEITYSLKFLDEYIETHFTHEENFIDEYYYPGGTTHKLEHDKFRKLFKEIKERLKAEGPSKNLSIQTSSFLGQWWIDHINKVDRELGAFLQKKLP